MLNARLVCPGCGRKIEIPLPASEARCSCGRNLLEHATPALAQAKLDQCPVCGCQHLHRKKDFNPRLGVALVAVGIALSFFTYGLSLLVVTLIDFILYRRVGDVGRCYECGSEFRGESIALLPEFQLVLHDHYRAVRANR